MLSGHLRRKPRMNNNNFVYDSDKHFHSCFEWKTQNLLYSNLLAINSDTLSEAGNLDGEKFTVHEVESKIVRTVCCDWPRIRLKKIKIGSSSSLHSCSYRKKLSLGEYTENGYLASKLMLRRHRS